MNDNNDLTLNFIVFLTIGLILFKLAGLITLSWWWIVGILLLGRAVILLSVLMFLVLGTALYTLGVYTYVKIKERLLKK